MGCVVTLDVTVNAADCTGVATEYNINDTAWIVGATAVTVDQGSATCELDALAAQDAWQIELDVAPVFLGPVTVSASATSIEKELTESDNAATEASVTVISADVDDDTIEDALDNCVFVANADQRDTDADGYGNLCDADLNNDGVINIVDLGLLRSVFFSADANADFDGDGVVNVQDLGVLRSMFFGAPGPSGLVSSLDPQQVRAFLSLGQVGAGEHELVLKSENILLAPGLEVERITPSAITVEMERILDKNVRVKADLKGPPPDGFEVDAVGLKPDYVRIRGPATILEDVTVMQTRTIDLQSLRVRDGQASQDVPLKIDTPSIELPELERRQVQVTIRFRPVEAKREEGATRTHTVQKGDTLYEIGKEYGVPIEAVRRLNNLKPGEYLQPGQELKIPPS